MASKTTKWKLTVDEGVYTQYQLAARHAKISPEKFANRVLEDFLANNRALLLDKSPDRLKQYVQSGKVEPT